MKLNHFSYIQKEDIPHGKVIIVGMMEDGPTGSPFLLNENGSATFLLGDNEVSRAYNTLIKSGVPTENIVLFRLNGFPAQAEIEVDGQNVFVMQTMTSHSEDQNITFTSSEEGVVLRSRYSQEAIDSGRRKNFTRTYRYEDYPYLADLAEAITADAALSLHNVVADYRVNMPSESLRSVIGPKAFLYGQEESALAIQDGQFPTGSIDQEGSYLYDYWQKFYYHLLGLDFDGESSSKVLDIASEVIYFPDAPIDELPELAILAGRVAQQKTEKQTVLCTALFRTGLVPKERELQENEYMNSDGTFYNADTDSVETWRPKAEQESFVHKLEDLFTIEEKDYPEMNYVQIVVGENQNSYGEILPGATHHLIHLISQDLHSTTNKELPLFEQLRAPFDQKAIDKLRAKGYICIVDSVRRNKVTTKVQTPYNLKERKDNFYFRKILSYIAYDIKQLLDRYIGGRITPQAIDDIEDVLTQYLNQYVEERLVESFALGERVVDPTNHHSGLPIQISMYGQVEQLKGTVQLNEAGWEVDLWDI